MSSLDTIVAAATAAVRGGVAVVRISGEMTLDIIKKISGKREFSPRIAEFCVVDTGEIRDESLVIFFAAPRSYTGENVAEIHCHGNPLIVAEIIKFCIKNGARMAEAGEFTKRAYLNGKTDLSAAEAVADIINAETKLQLSSAEQLREGRLFGATSELQSEIYDLIAELNAAIDYPEEDIEESAISFAAARAGEISAKLKKLAATFESGRLIREGVKIAILGAPNVGKSSLLNSILGKNRAIVSSEAGTTRDTVEDRYEFGGMMFVIADTAGIRETEGAIEKMGIERALIAANECDIVLSVSDERGEWLDCRLDKPIIYVKNKSDLTSKNMSKDGKENDNISATIGNEKQKPPREGNCNCSDIIDGNKQKPPRENDIIEVSALYNDNIDRLKQLVFDRACGSLGDGFVLTNLRHFSSVDNAARFLDSAAKLAANESPEIISVDLFDAVNELGKITGLIGSDEVVDRIFSKFCVGK